MHPINTLHTTVIMHDSTAKCVENFKIDHPDVCEAIYLGDQADKEFMQSGGLFVSWSLTLTTLVLLPYP